VFLNGTEALDLTTYQMFWDWFLDWHSREVIGKEDGERIWIKYYVFFISDFFHV
jgi:hypothetical protein